MPRLATLATKVTMAWYRRKHVLPFEDMATDPDRAQHVTLMRLLRANRDTHFGRQHGFGSVGTLHDYQHRVPVQRYETLAPFMDEQRRHGVPALTAEFPLFYAQTSGTTGQPKYLPVTPTAFEQHRAEQQLFSYLQYRACPAAYAGGAFGIMGAAVEDRLDTGHEVGSISGRLYAALPRVLQRRLVVPPEVAAIEDYDIRYDALLLLALSRDDVTYAGTPNPSTLLRLLDVLAARRDQLLDALATGRFAPLATLPEVVRAAIEPRLVPQPARAARLARTARLDFTHLWPRLALLTTWTGGSCGTALSALRARLPHDVRVMELGYQATEVRGTIPLELEHPGGLPPIQHHVFEFAEPAAWDAGRTATVPLADLEVGRQYYVIVTTAAGLYRYFMNDIVEVTGHFRRTPLLKFVQKGRGVTNITGEKLYEAQVIQAVGDACADLTLVPRFYVLVARDAAASYRLFLERAGGETADATLGARVDARLQALNIEYASKRRSGRLSSVDVAFLRPGAADAYRMACVRAGQRDGQLKPPVLEYEQRLLLDLMTLVEPATKELAS